MVGASDAVLFIVAATIAICITIYLMFFWTLYRAIQQVRPKLRQISPGAVWLCLIPVLGGVFAFWMVDAIATSLRKQFKELDRDDPSCSYGHVAGVLWILPTFLMILIRLMGVDRKDSDSANTIYMLLGLVSFVAWIFYWSQISNFGKRLK